MTVTTQREECSATVGGRLLMSMELGRRQWKLGFTTGVGNGRAAARCRLTPGIDCRRRLRPPRSGFGCPPTHPSASCYEAGRDGFWIHRYLTGVGVENLVVDSSSIEVNRRARRAKTDGWISRSCSRCCGATSVARRTSGGSCASRARPTKQRRQPHRELLTLKDERTRVTNRIAGLLATVGVLIHVDAKFGARSID